MAFQKPTIEDIRDLANRTYQNTIADKSVARGSDNWTRNVVLAGAVSIAIDLLEAADRDADPRTALRAKLEGWANTVGLVRSGATQASGENAGLVAGTPGSTWLTTDALVHANGNRYFPTSSGTIPAGGSQLVGIISEGKGSDKRLTSGEVLTWVTTPTGLEDEVELQADLDSGGQDSESDGSLQTRTLTRFAEPSMGGNPRDYVDWILQSNDEESIEGAGDILAFGIATGYVWPQRNGKGSVDIAGLKAGSGSVRLLNLSERTALFDYVENVRPAGHEGIRVLEVTPEEVDVELTILPQDGTQFAKDWDDSTPLVVLTWTPATRILVFTTDRPASMEVGDAIVVEDTSGEPQVIESLSSTDAVVLKDPTVTPVATNEVYSSGPLTIPARDAILDVIDSLGPRLGEFGVSRIWQSTLQTTDLEQAVGAIAGVARPMTVAPASDTEPTAKTFPVDDDEVNLLIPRYTIVRYV